MTHYRMLEDNPSALILAKNPRTGSLEETKTYRGTDDENVVYLSDKQTFAFKLFNPLNEKIGVKIILNGQTSDNLLVLNPGQDVTLERFLNESKKMLFETYTVDGSNEQVKKAIANNGDVRFEFYKETQPKWHKDVFYSASLDNFNTGDVTFGNTGGIRGACGNSLTSSLGFKSKSMSKSLETGRVEKGEKSNQNLEHIDVEFEQTSFHVIDYKLLPVSQFKKQSNKYTEVRNYCPNCRYRIRKRSWLYCPKCATEL